MNLMYVLLPLTMLLVLIVLGVLFWYYKLRTKLVNSSHTAGTDAASKAQTSSPSDEQP